MWGCSTWGGSCFEVIALGVKRGLRFRVWGQGVQARCGK